MNFNKMNKTFAIQRLHEANPNLKRDLVKTTKFITKVKVGPFHKESVVDLYIDDIDYNLVIYYDNKFHCLINKYTTAKLKNFLTNKEIPSPQECLLLLT